MAERDNHPQKTQHAYAHGERPSTRRLSVPQSRNLSSSIYGRRLIRFFKARVWLVIFGAMILLGGALTAIGAESIALDEWGDVDGKALDIAIALEVAWGSILSVWGASLVVITLSLQRARGRARFGAITVVAVFLSQGVAVGALSNLGYGED